jgi:hypothetical protein
LKVFFIFNEASLGNDKIIPLISVFADIESIGKSQDLLEAIDAIRQRYPQTAIADEKILNGNPRTLTPMLKKEQGPLIILPENYRLKEKCVYAGLDFSSKDLGDLDWIIRSIKRMIRECHDQTA